MSRTRKTDRPSLRPVYPTRLHWIAAGIGAAVFFGVIAILLGYGLSEGDGPPVIVVSTGPAVRVPQGFAVAVEVENSGGSTAAEIELEGRTGQGTGDEGEVARARLDYLPPGSTRKATLLFSQDPMARGLRVRTLGYRTP